MDVVAKKNILYVIPSMDSGGVEVGFFELARKNFEMGNKINMFLLTSGGKMVSKLVHYRVNCIQLDVKSKNPITIFRNIKKIKKIIIDNKINIVQVESRVPAWSCYFACKDLNIPMITVVNGLYDSKSFFKRLYNSSIFRGNPIITVSSFAMEYSLKFYRKYIYTKKSRKDVYVVHRSIDTDVYNDDSVSTNRVLELQKKFKLPDDKVIITMPARFAEQKGHDYFLEVLNNLKNDNYFCVFVGDVNKKPKFVKYIKKLIYKYNLQRNVGIYENILDMPALYKVSNIVVSSSVKPESFGRVSIEAQAMKKIFVGTAIGGTLETIIDGKTGFLVPENDAVAFAEKLDNILSLTKEEQTAIGLNSRKHVVDNFSIDVMYNSMVNIYNSINNTN